MAGCVIRAGNRHFLHKTPISRQRLEQIADSLGIAQAVRNEILSTGEWIHIYVGASPTPGAPPPPAARGRRRRT